MLGLVNNTVERFVAHTYGLERWQSISEAAGLEGGGFEAMLVYDDALTDTLLAALQAELGRDLGDILEDLGTYLVSHEEERRLRRLLRFSGVTYLDFLMSLDDLPDRVKLAITDLALPPLELREYGGGAFTLTVGAGIQGFAHVVMGVLRAMADDYGALVLLEYQGQAGQEEAISIQLIDSSYAEGRDFALGAQGT